MVAFGAGFFVSSLLIDHNAFKNIIFRIATIALHFVTFRTFSLLAFWQSDYTSFLIFGEGITQKAKFIWSRGLLSRQSLLVGLFALVVAAGEFYDTVLWALDNPGFVVKHSLVDGSALASQLTKNPPYVIAISIDHTDASATSELGPPIGAGLYTAGVNYTIPGIFASGVLEVAPPLYPLGLGLNESPRIWLDDEGFAVGLDTSIMNTRNMTRSLETACIYRNDPDSPGAQTWNCNVPNTEASDFLGKQQGLVPIWWDINHPDELVPVSDNPWATLGTDAGTMLMKQVITVTKGLRRHTFLSTILKASMTTSAPHTLDDGEVSDFMRKTWSPDGTTTAAVQGLTDLILQAKGNNTGRTFGEFVQTNTSLLAISTDYLNVVSELASIAQLSVLRFVLTNTTLIRSETITDAPAPFEPCPEFVYRNTAAGGQARSTNCNLQPGINQSVPLNGNLFLGQMDASAVGIFNTFLGDGSSNISSVALTQSGLDWLNQQNGNIDRLLISRAMLVAGNNAAVSVDLGVNVPAISLLQLVLSLLPCVLVILIWPATQSKALSYYQNSFLAAVLVTTHTTTLPCDRLGDISSMPEITVQKKAGHVTLGTPYGGTITNTVAIAVHEPGAVYEPLVLGKDSV